MLLLLFKFLIILQLNSGIDMDKKWTNNLMKITVIIIITLNIEYLDWL